MSDSKLERPAPSRWAGLLTLWAIVIGLGWLTLPFIAAGTLRCHPVWLYMVTIAIGAGVQRVYIARRNPEILARRRTVGVGTKGWDVAWALVAGLFTLLPPVVAGLGVREGWATMPLPCAVLGVLANTVGGVIFARSMASNPHFESTARIQRERGHMVVQSGPYRVVRHPGYLGFCIGSLGAPLMLLSWPAMAVAPLLAVWFVVRTALEDAMLRKELEGYSEYARRVRYRLVPGLW
jgi:protein-S-isoprenylcysteine O-methyltransferase Ste14